jgi:hypothetical protein
MQEPMDFRTPVTRCPVCGHKLDAATAVNGKRPPIPGAVSVCIRCSALLIFDQDLNLRKLAKQDLIELRRDPQIWGMIVHIQQHISRRN